MRLRGDTGHVHCGTRDRTGNGHQGSADRLAWPRTTNLFKPPSHDLPELASMTRTLILYEYVQFILLGISCAAIALAHLPWAQLWMAGLILAAIALSFAVEQRLPYNAEWNTAIGDGTRDALHSFMNETALLLTVLVIAVITALSPFGGPTSLPFVAQVLLAVTVTDIGVTLVYVASHRVGWLWRMHAVHHSVRRFYGLNGLMKHPLHVPWNWRPAPHRCWCWACPQLWPRYLPSASPCSCCFSVPTPTIRLVHYAKSWPSMRGTASIT